MKNISNLPNKLPIKLRPVWIKGYIVKDHDESKESPTQIEGVKCVNIQMLENEHTPGINLYIHESSLKDRKVV